MQTALKFLNVLRAIDPNMPMGAAHSLLLIAAGQGLSIGELKALSGDSMSSVSRYHGYLGSKHRDGNPGKELVTAQTGVADVRRKSLKLTPKGRRVIGQMTSILSTQPRRIVGL